jgi:hypothetical protein
MSIQDQLFISADFSALSDLMKTINSIEKKQSQERKAGQSCDFFIP